MSKRYTDSRKWAKDWLIALPNEYKLLWFYMLDTCTISGIWDVSFVVPEVIFQTKFDKTKVLEMLGKQVSAISESKWFINDFIAYQYKKLNPESRPHKAVITELEEAGLWDYETENIKLGTAEPISVPVRKLPGMMESESLENVKVSDVEYQKLVAEYGLQTTKEAIEFLSSYKIEKNYKTKSDYLTIRRWVIKAVSERKGRMKPGATNKKGASTESILEEWEKGD